MRVDNSYVKGDIRLNDVISSPHPIQSASQQGFWEPNPGQVCVKPHLKIPIIIVVSFFKQKYHQQLVKHFSSSC